MKDLKLNQVTLTILNFKATPKIRQISFDQLVTELKPRLDFQVRKHSGKIPGYDDDDIRQELLIELWNKLDRIPEDMEYVDYRFTRYIERMFERKIIELHRSLLYIRRQGYGGARLVEGYRDGLLRSVFVENIEELFEA